MSDQARIAEVLRRHRRVLNLDSGTSHCFAARSGQCDFAGGVRADWEAHVAPLIDAALHPRIDTLEQLDALPFLTIVREVYGPSPSGCDYGAVWERRTSGWQCIAGSVMPPRDEHAPRLGCRVLYTPEVDR